MTGKPPEPDQNHSTKGQSGRHPFVSRDERQRQEEFARAVDGWLWETDENLRFTYMSDNVEEMTGVPPEWHYGKTRRELGPPDVNQEEWLAHIATLERHEPFRGFVYHRLGPEKSEWLRSDGFPIFDEEGTFVGYRGVGRFVTPEVEARQEARQSQELLSAAIDGLEETFALWDENDRLIICNEQFRKLNTKTGKYSLPGATSEEHFRATVEAGLVPPAIGREEEWLKERIERYRSPGEPFELPRQDGRWILVREHSVPGVGTATVSTDITLQKQAELAAQKSEQRFRDIAEASTDWYWETDRTHRFTYFSQSQEEKSDVSPHLNLGRTRAEFVLAEFLETPEWQGHVDDLVNIRSFRDFEYPYKRRDQSVGWMRINGKPILDSSGNFAGYRGAASEVTELHKITAEMIAARERAEAANKAKTEFLSSMSHELRTPLNSILGFSQLMNNDLDHPLNDDQSDSMQQIMRSSQHLLDLIDDMLDLAQIESGRLVTRSETVSLNDTLESCLASISGLAEEKNVTLHYDEGQEDILLRADTVRFRQVLLNLLSNAVKYNRPSGRVDISSEIKGAGCRIYVRDTGSGFNSADQEKLFEPFVRLGWENSDTQGTGIGLAICKRLVVAMKGNIDCTSVPGEGSTFWIDFPLDRHSIKRAPARVSGTAAPRSGDKNGGSDGSFVVLYVEDNKANMALMEQVMKRHEGTRLLVAETAEAGLKIARTELPDVIVMDINLPGMDGFSALKKLRKREETSHIPVIALSADAMPHQVSKGIEKGFHTYLTKPLDISIFNSLLQKLQQESPRQTTASPTGDPGGS